MRKAERFSVWEGLYTLLLALKMEGATSGRMGQLLEAENNSQMTSHQSSMDPCPKIIKHLILPTTWMSLETYSLHPTRPQSLQIWV